MRMAVGRNGRHRLTAAPTIPGVLQHAAFFLASLAWNLGLGMTWLAVPLYAYAQGLSNAEIGILFAVPVLAQAPLNLVGGAYTDRIGGRRILLGSCVATIAAGLWFMFAQGFWTLLAGRSCSSLPAPRSGRPPGRWRASCPGHAAPSSGA